MHTAAGAEGGGQSLSSPGSCLEGKHLYILMFRLLINIILSIDFRASPFIEVS